MTTLSQAAFDPDRYRTALDAARGVDLAGTEPKPFSGSKTSNWVAKAGGLPTYIQHVAHAILENASSKVKDTSSAIAVAISQTKKRAAAGNEQAVKALAEWEKMKAGTHAKAATSLGQDEREGVRLVLAVEALVSRADQGLILGQDSLDLAGPIVFDPGAHPRDLKGQFRKAIDGLSVGQTIKLPDGTSVVRAKDGEHGLGARKRFEVHHGEFTKNTHEGRPEAIRRSGNAQAAARDALETSAYKKKPESLGGAVRHTSVDSAIRSHQAIGKDRDHQAAKSSSREDSDRANISASGLAKELGRPLRAHEKDLVRKMEPHPDLQGKQVRIKAGSIDRDETVIGRTKDGEFTVTMAPETPGEPRATRIIARPKHEMPTNKAAGDSARGAYTPDELAAAKKHAKGAITDTEYGHETRRLNRSTDGPEPAGKVTPLQDMTPAELRRARNEADDAGDDAAAERFRKELRGRTATRPELARVGKPNQGPTTGQIKEAVKASGGKVDGKKLESETSKARAKTATSDAALPDDPYDSKGTFDYDAFVKAEAGNSPQVLGQLLRDKYDTEELSDIGRAMHDRSYDVEGDERETYRRIATAADHAHDWKVREQARS